MDKITDIILKNDGLIYKIISKYRNYFELDDLYQVAVIGIIKAYNNYKEGYNAKFISYAYPYILGEVIKYINDFRGIKLDKNMKVLYSKIIKAKEVLSQKLMKEPSVYELSLFLELDEKVINDVMVANYQIDSLDRIISEEDKNLELYNRCGYVDNKIENYSLMDELNKLPCDEKQIIISRYYENMSQKEVGDSLGMYQVQISRKEKKILQKLRDKIAV